MPKSGVSLPVSAVNALPPAARIQARRLRRENSEPTAYPAAIAVMTPPLKLKDAIGEMHAWVELQAIAEKC